MLLILIMSLILILILSVIYISHRRNMKLLKMVSSPDRGTRSERRLVIRLLKNGVPPEAVFHDLYLPKQRGGYAQVDVLVVTPQGLVVIEMKDYSGWLFGSESQQYWTQVLNYGKEKYHFYNPLKQNQGHIKALREQSEQLSRIPIWNVVLFDGDCELKRINYSTWGSYVGYSSQVMDVLKRINEMEPAHYTNKKEISWILHRAVRNGDDPVIVSQHIASVREINSYR